MQRWSGEATYWMTIEQRREQQRNWAGLKQAAAVVKRLVMVVWWTVEVRR